MSNQIIHGDCFEILKSFPDNYFDAIITDPPYGINLAEWDKVIDIFTFTEEVKRLLNDGFYCFFGQMPTVINWINFCHELELEYKDHVVWAKRSTSAIGLGLHRTHESLFIYKKGNPKYYKKKGSYQDIKIPLLFVQCLNWETIERNVGEIRYYLKHGKRPRMRTQDRQKTVNFDSRNNISYSARILETNFTNLWSFLPQNQKTFNKGGKEHPTQKPLELIKRLVELTTKEGDVILDPFAGSGTLAIACLETNRKYVCIEKDDEYFEVMKKRISQWHNDRLNATGTYQLPDDIERINYDENSGQMSLF